LDGSKEAVEVSNHMYGFRELATTLGSTQRVPEVLSHDPVSFSLLHRTRSTPPVPSTIDRRRLPPKPDPRFSPRGGREISPKQSGTKRYTSQKDMEQRYNRKVSYYM
jgi:hypothetical protein